VGQMDIFNGSVKGIVHPKNENDVIIYSPRMSFHSFFPS